jgi:hypothetical protein
MPVMGLLPHSFPSHEPDEANDKNRYSRENEHTHEFAGNAADVVLNEKAVDEAGTENNNKADQPERFGFHLVNLLPKILLIFLVLCE